jgi:hypothetical protein
MMWSTYFPDKTLVTFEDGPCAGMTIQAPGRSGMPPMMVFVRPDGTDPRAGSDHDGSDGYVKYFPRVDVRRRPGDPWVLLWYDVDRVPKFS